MRGLNSRYARGWELIARLVRDEGRSFSGRERNCCFVNTGSQRFAQASATTGLDLIDDARASAVVDWDQDGDLDLWLTNRTGPRARFLKNQTGNRAGFISIRLTGVDCNRDAIGARVEVRLPGDQRSHIRTVHAGDGFLAQSSKAIHFGLGEVETIERLTVRWPDSSVQTFSDVSANQHYRLTQGKSLAALPPRGEVKLQARKIEQPAVADVARVQLSSPRSLRDFELRDFSGRSTSLSALTNSQPFLLNLWQHTCLPCLKELKEFSQSAREVRQAGLDIVAVHLSSPGTDTVAERSRAEQALSKIGFKFTAALGDDQAIQQLEEFQKAVLQRHQGIVFPTSLLVNSDGEVAAVYKGPLTVQQLLDDADLIRGPSQRGHLPFPGKWYRTD